MFVKNNEACSFNLAPGIKSKILGNSSNLMAVENTFDKGIAAPAHSHFHEQVSYVAAGVFEFTLDGEFQILHAGDSVYVEGNKPHNCAAIEAGIIVDIFTPQREDFLAKIKK